MSIDMLASLPSSSATTRRRRSWRGRPVAAAIMCLALSIAAAGCGDDTAVPTEPGDPTPFSRSEIFEGTLSPSGSGFYSFTVGTTGSVEITLTSLVGASGGTIDREVVVGFGVPSGFDCATSATAPAAPSLGPQVTRAVEAGTYCARINDPGVLSGTATFAVRITIRTGSAPTPAPGSLTFSSQLAVGGFTSRAFVASVNGQLTARLETVDPAGVRVGLGVGVPTSVGGCAVTRQVLDAGPGTEISLAVAGATYCVTVFDTGTLAAPASFTVRIDHP